MRRFLHLQMFLSHLEQVLLQGSSRFLTLTEGFKLPLSRFPWFHDEVLQVLQGSKGSTRPTDVVLQRSVCSQQNVGGLLKSFKSGASEELSPLTFDLCGRNLTLAR